MLSHQLEEEVIIIMFMWYKISLRISKTFHFRGIIINRIKYLLITIFSIKEINGNLID